MATNATSSTPGGVTNAAFVAWGQDIHNALAACGLSQTSDTGQINWGTTSYVPTSTGGATTSAGYEIWAFADSLQSSAPVYIRIDYISFMWNGTNGQGFSIKVTIGTGTNGAGTLTGNVSATWTPNVVMPQYQPTLAGTTYMSGDGSRIQVLMNAGQSNAFFTVGRSKDANGNNTSDFVYFWAASYGTAPGGTFGTNAANRILTLIPPTGSSIVTAETNPGTPNADVPTNVSTGQVGNNVNVFCHYPFDYETHNPDLGTITYFTGDFTALTPISVSIYGTTHTYLPLGSSINPTNCTRAGVPTSGVSLLMRWE